MIEYNYTQSICFSAEPAEMLNEKAFAIDHRLYLFAYYEPKKYLSSESHRSQFVTAIINLYGLLWDCSPFTDKLVRKSSGIFKKNGRAVKKNFDELKSVVGAFRGIFCHNCSREFELWEESYRIAESWIDRFCVGQPEIAEINEDEWNMLLRELSCMADLFISDFTDALAQLHDSKDKEQKEIAVLSWIVAIAESYKRNPQFLLNTMAALYQWYLDNGGNNEGEHIPLRTRTLNWLVSNCNAPNKKVWYEPWLGTAGEPIENSNVYNLLQDWPQEWAVWNDCVANECTEAPLPAGCFFRILANDVDAYAANPSLGYATK